MPTARFARLTLPVLLSVLTVARAHGQTPEPAPAPAAPAPEPTAPVPAPAAATPAIAELPHPIVAEPPHVVADHSAVDHADGHHSPWHWRSWLQQRLTMDEASVVQSLGPTAGDAGLLRDGTQLESRSRAGTELAYTAKSGFLRKAIAELEVQVRYWDRPEPPLASDAFALRQGKLELTTLAGQFTLGRTVSSWGLGLLAQDGAYDPLQFGAKRGATTVTRLGYGILPAAIFGSGDPTKAFPLALAVARDWVAVDDLAQYRGDKAANLVAALLYRGSSLQTGAYVVRRDQTGDGALALQATVIDGFARYKHKRPGGRYVELAAEALYIMGHTDWLKSPSSPAGLDVAQYGGVARLETGNAKQALRTEVGLASADALPLNGTLRSFRFASDYKVGLVLFGQVQRQLSEQAVRNLSDGRYTNAAPAAVDRVATQGALTQAAYLHQVLRMQASPHIAVLFGGLVAHSPADVADPFRTFLNGGKATGPRGAIGKRGLGFELDAGLEAAAHPAAWLTALARIEGGVWFPGDAFDTADGQPMAAVGAVQGQIHLRSEF